MSFLVLATFVAIILSTAYYALAYSPDEFYELPEVKQYDNLVEKVTHMDYFSRMQFYWSNNLSIAGLMAITFPTYFGPNLVVATGYQVGVAMVFNQNMYGPTGILVFVSTIFVHGILELTGIFIVGAASLRMGWNLWRFLGGIIDSRLKFKLTKRPRRKFKLTKRRRAAIKQNLIDYISLFALAVVMILLAAPIESYISPWAGAVFLFIPVLAGAFLGVVIFFYASLVRLGFTPMRRTFVSVWGDVKALVSGNWRPAQLAVLLLVIFSFLLWFL